MPMRLIIESPNARTECYSGMSPQGQATTVLDLSVERQEKSRWCWSAIAVSLARFYGTGDWRQSDLAAQVLAGSGSLPPENETDPLNREALLEDALRLVRCFSHWSSGRPTFERLAMELSLGRPLCVRVGWHKGGGHYAVISACAPETRKIFVNDPLHGISAQLFDNFPAYYLAKRGVWAETIWTRSPGEAATL